MRKSARPRRRPPPPRPRHGERRARPRLDRDGLPQRGDRVARPDARCRDTSKRAVMRARQRRRPPEGRTGAVLRAHHPRRHAPRPRGPPPRRGPQGHVPSPARPGRRRGARDQRPDDAQHRLEVPDRSAGVEVSPLVLVPTAASDDRERSFAASPEAVIAARADVAVEAGFAVAHDRAGGISHGGCDRVIELGTRVEI